MIRVVGAASLAVALTLSSASAQEVAITDGVASVDFSVNGQDFSISRIQDTENEVTGPLARTSAPCPTSCIQPVSAAPGVSTVAELEVLSFLQTHVADGRGLLIDARLPTDFAARTIPGAVNVPSTTLDATNPYRDQILIALGAVETAGALNFDAARNLVLFCDGPTCPEAGRTVRNLIDAGYPAEKLAYYRGGLQHWALVGLTLRP